MLYRYLGQYNINHINLNTKHKLLKYLILNIIQKTEISLFDNNQWMKIDLTKYFTLKEYLITSFNIIYISLKVYIF